MIVLWNNTVIKVIKLLMNKTISPHDGIVLSNNYIFIDTKIDNHINTSLCNETSRLTITFHRQSLSYVTSYIVSQ